jgi:hypothetical protein
LAQTVQDGAFNAVLGIAGKGHLFVGVELRGGIKQAEDSGMNEVV